jgi:CheY-like chemotaxis protein
MNIVIIEDDPIDRKLVCAVLTSSGHSVRTHMTAEQAITAIQSDKPDLVLVDLHLPGMDGLSFIRQFKQNPGTCHIPVVVMTGFPSRFKKDEVMAAGCDAYLTKPIDTRALPQTVAEAVVKKI